MALADFISSLASKAKKLVTEEAKRVPELLRTAATQAGGVPAAAIKYAAEKAYELAGQPIARNIAGSALDIYGGVTGKVDPKTLASQARIKTAGSPVLTKFFGSESVPSTSQRLVETQAAGRQIAGPLGEAAAVPGLALLMGLESSFTPGSPAKKVIQKGVTKAAAKAIPLAAKAKSLVDDAARVVAPGAKEAVEATAPKVSRARALVDDLAARAVPVAREGAEELPKTPINVARLNVPEVVQRRVADVAEQVRPSLEKAVGKTLSNAEVVEAAKISPVLSRAVSRETTLAEEAAILKLRQQAAALAKEDKVTGEFIETLRTLKTIGTDRGRQLQALSIGADPELGSIRTKMLQKIASVTDDVDAIVQAAKNVDFNDAKQATAFYRKFVKPTIGEVVDEFRYMNMLSSPKTHIVNAFSNILQTSVVRPATRAAAAVIDPISSAMTGKQREFYLKQVPAYYRGLTSSLGDAAQKALEVMQNKQFVTNLDLDRIPTGNRVTAAGRVITNALEASDVFFRTLVEGAESMALQAGGKTAAQAAEPAAETAAYTVFRKALDSGNLTGQGGALSAIDGFTEGIQAFGRKAPVIRWFVPFIQTPMNILKQGLEFSPAGVLTLPGNTKKVEQLAKALVGSTVMAAAGSLAAQGKLSWALPKGKEERDAFYAAGMQPYAVKVGDRWVGYDKLGPISYPIAMAAAMKWYLSENPEAATKTNLERATDALAGIAEFFTDQSYMQGIQNLGTFGKSLVEGRGGAAVTKQASSLVGQLVPLASLQRWATRLIDPVFRKPGQGISVNAIVQNLVRDLPVLSKTVEPYLTPGGEESRRTEPVLSGFTPFNVTREQPEYIKQLQSVRSETRLRDIFTKQSDTLKEQFVTAIRSDADITEVVTAIAEYNAAVAEQVQRGLEEGTGPFTDPEEARKFVVRYQLGKDEIRTALKKALGTQ